MTPEVRPRLDLPLVALAVVDQGFASVARRLTEERSDRGAVGNRFGVELL
jgi:hypothetical protein